MSNARKPLSVAGYVISTIGMLAACAGIYMYALAELPIHGAVVGLTGVAIVLVSDQFLRRRA